MIAWNKNDIQLQSSTVAALTNKFRNGLVISSHIW